MKHQFFVGDVVKVVDVHEPVEGAVWTSTMDDCHGRTGTVADIVNYTNGYIGYVVNVGFEHYNFAPEWLTIVERAWQKNTGKQPVDDDVVVQVKQQRDNIPLLYTGRAKGFIWIRGPVISVDEWRIADSGSSDEEQPEAIPPSHVALGGELVQVGEPYMKIWCDTCQGTGEIDETVGGLPPQYAREDAPCPDCDGKGWWERVIAASVDNAFVQQDKKHSHYFKKCGYDYVDVYRVLKMFDVTDPCISHACKKLLVSGGRGFKDIDHDIQDVIDTLVRWQEMRKEDDELCK